MNAAQRTAVAASAALAMLSSACAAPAVIPPAPPKPSSQAAACPLTVAFGSYAMGIDAATYARVEALLSADLAVTAVERTPWGREGEVTLCARTRSPADAERLLDSIAALFPAAPRGPISVATAAGRTIRAPR
jgi:hypothetical protein